MRPAVQENIELASYTTFKIGGNARYFVEVKSTEELKAALAWAEQKKQPVFVLAGGSNLIISSKGFAGLVIKVDLRGYDLNAPLLSAFTGATMGELVDVTTKAGLAGLEWAGGLPGTLGGAIRGNAGAFGGEIKDCIESVTTINVQSGKLAVWPNQDCLFDYRESRFKSDRSEVIISAVMKLKPGSAKELETIAADHVAFRANRHPLEYPNAGSIFKNTPLEKVPVKWLERNFKDFVKNDPFPIVPSGKIIEDAGLRGFKKGKLEVSQKHANYIVNLGGATAEEVVELIKYIQQTVKTKFGIELEVEPELVGF